MVANTMRVRFMMIVRVGGRGGGVGVLGVGGGGGGRKPPGDKYYCQTTFLALAPCAVITTCALDPSHSPHLAHEVLAPRSALAAQ